MSSTSEIKKKTCAYATRLLSNMRKDGAREGSGLDGGTVTDHKVRDDYIES